MGNDDHEIPQDVVSDVLSAAQQMLESWTVVLETYDGMVRQTIERGWTEDQARGIVYACITVGPDDQGDEKP